MTSRLLVASLVLLALMAPTVAGEDYFFSDSNRVQIAASRSSSGGLANAIDTFTNDQGDILASYSNASTDCYVARSTDDGATWTETNIGGSGGSGGSSCPMVKKSETEYLAFDGTSAVWRTTNSGLTWASYSTVTDTCTGSPSRFHAMDVNHANPLQVMVVWHGGTGSSQICGTYSADGGATWGAMFTVSGLSSITTLTLNLAHLTGDVWHVTHLGASSLCNSYTSTNNGGAWTLNGQVTASCSALNYASKRFSGEDCLCFHLTVNPSGSIYNAYFVESVNQGTSWTASLMFTAAASAIPGNGVFESGVFQGVIYRTAATESTPRVFIHQDDSATPIGASFPSLVSDTALGFLADGTAYLSGKQTSGTVNQYFILAEVDLEPEAPAGVSAIVTQVAPADSQVELRWLVSANDPDQAQGDFTYEIFVEGVSVGDDSTTTADGDGIRFNLLQGFNQEAGLLSFKVRAENPDNGATSTFSCSVSVDVGVLSDSDTCGETVAAGGSAHTIPDAASDVGEGLVGFCAALMGDSTASLFFCGLIFVVVVFLAVAAAFAALAGGPGLPAAIGGSITAMGFMVFNIFVGLWEIWAGAVLIILASAVVGLAVKALIFGKQAVIGLG